MSEVFFEVLSPLPLSGQRDARQLFELWEEVAPRFFPDRTGLSEPLKQGFSMAVLEDALLPPEFQIMLKRVVEPKLQANIFRQAGQGRKHSLWDISLEKLRNFDQATFHTLLRRSAFTLSADLGFIHCISESEIERGRQNGSINFLDSKKTRKTIFITTHQLRKYLPDIYWMTLFGKPYVELFSRERLLGTPCHHVEELENGSILIQLTPSLTDVWNEELGFERVRTEAKRHLNCDAFFDQEKGIDHQYRTAEFFGQQGLH